MIGPMIYTAYGFAAEPSRFRREPIASFFTQSDAVDFALHPERTGFEKRHVFVSAGREDKRTAGYRALEKPSGYREWLIEIGRCPKTGRARIAA